MTEEIDNIKSGKSPFQPFYYAAVLIFGILIGIFLADKNLFSIKIGAEDNPNKLVSLIDFIEENYVDSVDKKLIIDDAIAAILNRLDPHSSYFTPEQYAQAQEELNGSYEGIGIEFIILRDTLMVNRVIENGPSMQAGIFPGDRIVQVDGRGITGIGLTNESVMKMLKGKSGTTVELDIKRKSQTLKIAVQRGALPLPSVTASYELKPSVGYLKLERFGQNTYNEFVSAVRNLRYDGCNSLIIDLRDNGGGLLEQSTAIAEEFLEAGQLMVYTEGLHSPRKDYVTQKRGEFVDMKLAVLIDENSASASEILAGALQDWDRALIVGRRSFGKGLVQNEVLLPDNSAIRLTTARYYTPTGRCIQKPYDKKEAYHQETNNRWNSGEMYNESQIVKNDSMKKLTPKGRAVYGGGGIIPDVFAPYDSTKTSYSFAQIVNMGIIRNLGFDFLDHNKSITKKFNNSSEFIEKYSVPEGLIQEVFTNATQQNISITQNEKTRLRTLVSERMKAQITRTLYGEKAMIELLNASDRDISSAINALENYEQFFK
jgi:carboxyl-terminal processing protease